MVGRSSSLWGSSISARDALASKQRANTHALIEGRCGRGRWSLRPAISACVPDSYTATSAGAVINRPGIVFLKANLVGIGPNRSAGQWGEIYRKMFLAFFLRFLHQSLKLPQILDRFLSLMAMTRFGVQMILHMKHLGLNSFYGVIFPPTSNFLFSFHFKLNWTKSAINQPVINVYWWNLNHRYILTCST